MTIRKNLVWAGAAALLLSAPAMSAVPGQGWDAFQSRQGEPVTAAPYTGTAMAFAPGQGFDIFNARDGVQVSAYEKAYVGTSLGSRATAGWDVFRSGEGDPLP